MPVFRIEKIVWWAFTVLFLYAPTVFNQAQSQTNSLAPAASAPKVQYYVDYFPKHWSMKVIEEPVFGSRMLTAEVGDKSKPAIIFIHGLGDLGMRAWLGVVPALEKTHHIIAVDLPGFGGSANAQGRFSPSNYSKVVAFIKAHFLGDKKAAIVGHSMGGAVALRFSADYPDSVERLLLVDAAGILERTAFLKQNSTVRSSLLNALGLRGILTEVNDFSGNFVELVNSFPDPTKLIIGDQMWKTVFANKPNFNAGLALTQEDFTSAVTDHNIPTYIIWGGRDNIAPVRTAQMLAKRLNNAELSIIPEAGHAPMGSHPRVFNSVLSSKIMQASPNVTFDAVAPGDTNLYCNSENGKTYQGGYKHIKITNCSGVSLKHVHAETIEIQGSIVELENVTIYSNETAVTIENSAVLGTNLDVKGSTAFNITNSRLDLAGASITGTSEALRITSLSRLIFSISDLASPIYSGGLHGSYNDAVGLLDAKIQ